MPALPEATIEDVLPGMKPVEAEPELLPPMETTVDSETVKPVTEEKVPEITPKTQDVVQPTQETAEVQPAESVIETEQAVPETVQAVEAALARGRLSFSP